MAVSKKKLKATEIQKKLTKVSEWNLNVKQTELSKAFTFASFVNGLAFIAKITVHAEIMGHHPEIELSYGKVKVRLSTDDPKGLTNADFELAKKIDSLRVS